MAKKRQPLALPADLEKKVRRPKRLKPRIPKGLNAREQRFVEEYCVDLNMTQATIRAGYSRAAAAQIGYKLLRKTQIAAAIIAWRARLTNETELTSQEIRLRMQRLGTASVAHFTYIDPSGQPHIDLSLATREQLDELGELTVEDYVDGRGEDARDVKRVRLKLESRSQALLNLAKLKGDVTEKVEHSGVVSVDATKAEAFRVGPERAQQLADELGAAIAKIRAELKG